MDYTREYNWIPIPCMYEGGLDSRQGYYLTGNGLSPEQMKELGILQDKYQLSLLKFQAALDKAKPKINLIRKNRIVNFKNQKS